MKLTPFAKIFITLIIRVVGYVLYVKGDGINQWVNQGTSKPTAPAGDKTATGPAAAFQKDDFGAIGAAREASRQGVTGIAKAQVGQGKLRSQAARRHQHLGRTRAGHCRQRWPSGRRQVVDLPQQVQPKSSSRCRKTRRRSWRRF